MIDVHVHAFRYPELGRGYQAGMGNPTPERDGDIAELLPMMERAGIDQSVMLMYLPSLPMYRRECQRLPEDEARALVVDRIRRNNRWGIETAATSNGKLRVMVGVDPNLMTPSEIRDEIGQGVAAGASGGKIVLQALEIRANDPRMWPFYEICQELNVPIMMQSGGNARWTGEHYGRPRHFAEAFAAFPRLRLILAHLGQGYEDETVELTTRYPNCYGDLASRLSPHGFSEYPGPDGLAALIRRVGVDRVLFGTNYPSSDPVEFAQKLGELPISEAERAAIAEENAKRVFEA